MRNTVRELYVGESARARRFRYAVLIFDIATIIFVIATSFSGHGPVIEVVDAVVGLIILAEFSARLWITPGKLRFLTRPVTLAEIVAILSFLAPLAGEGLGFLRVMRTLRLLRAYHLTEQLKRDFPYFRRQEDVIIAVLNLAVFIFVMTGLVYATQYRINPQIGNYADALYFTVTALTTTGFGDITLLGTTGRMIAVLVMIFGVTLFLRLLQVLIRPNKVRHECTRCGLLLHDADAVHCKHCGEIVHIATEGSA